MSDKVAYIGCEMSVCQCQKEGNGLGLEIIGCAELLPDKTHHLYAKVAAVVVINYESVSANHREGQGMTR